MKFLRVLCPGHDVAVSAALRDAVAAFNRGLDIRLRFLSIGIEDRELVVNDAEQATAAVGGVLDEWCPDVVVLLGDGVSTVAAATIAARHPAMLARLCAGRRVGPEADAARAVDHLADVLLVVDDASELTLRDEGLSERTYRVMGRVMGRVIDGATDGATGGATGGDASSPCSAAADVDTTRTASISNDAVGADDMAMGRNVIKAVRAARARSSGDSTC